MTERGTGSAVWAFRGDAGDGILRVHILSRKVRRVLGFRILAGIPAKRGHLQKKGPPGNAGRPGTRGRLERFASRGGFRGRSRFGLGFAAIEPAHDISADGPGRDLGRQRFLAVRPFVGRADEFAFDEHVRAFLDGPSDVVCQAWPEQHDPVPLRF